MARLRYNKDETIGAAGDALSLRISIDVVDYPYANDAVSTLDSTTLANVEFEIGDYKQSLSSNGIPDEANVENISVKVYDKTVSTTVTTGANSATQTVGNTAGMSAGAPLHFATANVDRVIDHIASSTSVVLTAAVNSTTGETVTQAGTVWGILTQGIPVTKRLQFILWDKESGTYQPKYFVIDKASIAPEIKTLTKNNTNYDSVISFNAVSLLKMVLQESIASTDEAVALTIHTFNSVEPTSGTIDIRVRTSLATETCTIQYNASPSDVLTALQGLVTHGKYFVSCFSTNQGAESNNPPNQLNTTATVYIITINVEQLNTDHGINWLYSGLSTDTTPQANIYYSNHSLNQGVPAFSKNNGQFGSTYPSSYPLVPQNIRELSSLDYLIRTYPGGSLYQSPSNLWSPYFFWYSLQSNLWSGAPQFVNTISTFISFYDLLLVICRILRYATDITVAENVSANFDHLGVRASKAGAVPAALTVSYGATYEVGTSHLAQGMALHVAFIRQLVATVPEYSLIAQGSLYDAMKILCDSVLCLPYLTYDATTGITLTLKSPLSQTYSDLVSGNTEIIPVKDTLKVKSCAYQNDSANCGLKKPSGVSGATQNDNNSPSGDLFETEYIAPSSINGSGVSGQSIFGTFWNNWAGNVSGGNIPWLENSLMLFGTSSRGNTDVYGADYSMYDFPNTSDPFIANYGFVVNQGFGGGTLQGATVVTIKLAHYQQALAKGLFSLYCQQENSELIEFECPLTLAMIATLRQNPVLTRISVRTDALYNFLVLGVDYNVFDQKRTIKITAVRNR